MKLIIKILILLDSSGNGIFYHIRGETNIDFKSIFNYTHPRIDSNSDDSIIIKHTTK